MARLQLGKSLLQQLGVAGEATYTRSSIIGSVLADLPWNSRVRGVRFLKKKKIECILTTNVYKLGKTGDTVEVAPGYLRNYLLPNSMALPNLPHYALVARNKRKMDKASEGGEKDDLQLDGTDESQNKESIREYQTAVRRLDRALLGLRRLVLNYGKELRFPVTKKELIAEVERQLQVIIQPENVVMPDDITHCGTYEIPLRFPSSVPFPAGKKEHILKVKVQRR